jgi:hypothetical protein
MGNLHKNLKKQLELTTWSTIDMLENKLVKSWRIDPILDVEVERIVANFLKNKAVSFMSNDDKAVLLSTVQKRITEYLSPVIDLSEFSHMYPVNGITEGLNYLSMENKTKKIQLTPGDYEWLKYVHRPNVVDKEGDILYISNPSAIDGMIYNDTEWKKIIDSHKEIALDVAYIGSTKNKQIELNENVKYVFVGLSKMLGVSNLRIGFIFQKNRSISLQALTHQNFYFNPNSLLATLDLLDNFELGYIHKKYNKSQKQICDEYNLKQSDVVYMGTSDDPRYNFWKRDNSNRLCLTPLLFEQ